MAKKKKTHSKQSDILEPKWKTVEKVVAMLEQSLDPEARVTHNIKMPVLTSTTGSLRQIDVLIETGPATRVTRSIVEVQKRNQPVKIVEFDGWCQKLNDVGAHRLICVSAKPFPSSVKEKVANVLGPRVLLIRLEALESKNWPFQIVNSSFSVFTSDFLLDPSTTPNPKFMVDKNSNPLEVYDGVTLSFKDLPNVIKREGHEELLPMADIMNEGRSLIYDRPEFYNLRGGLHTVGISWSPKGTSICYKEKTAPILKVDIVFLVSITTEKFPFEISSYTQDSQDGQKTLAWVARAILRSEDVNMDVNITLSPKSDGGFNITTVHINGPKKSGTTILRTDKGGFFKIDH